MDDTFAAVAFLGQAVTLSAVEFASVTLNRIALSLPILGATCLAKVHECRKNPNSTKIKYFEILIFSPFLFLSNL